MHNPTLTRSLHALSHPITLAAVGVLLLNDHVLRRWWPSWMTGKLGDVAWLAFFPLIMALAFALIVPARVKARDQVVAGLAFGFTALLFALGKTVPAVHALIVAVLGAILRMPIGLRLDPTDLITLPALWIGWRVWWMERGVLPRVVTRRGWAVMALGAMATMANSPTPLSFGITCLLANPNGSLIAATQDSDDHFVSKDGGWTWGTTIQYRGSYPSQCPDSRSGEAWSLHDPDNTDTVYLFAPDQGVLRSVDGGEHWQVDLSTTLSEAQQQYYYQDWSSTGGPYDALFEPASGDLLVAMGVEGIARRTDAGKWVWIDVGMYHHQEYSDINALSKALGAELILAVVLGLFTPALLHTLVEGKSGIRLPFTVIFILLLILAIMTVPAGELPTFDVGLYMAFIFPLLIIAPSIYGFLSLSWLLRQSWQLWVVPLVIPVLFVVPYFLWTQNVIQNHSVATYIAVAMVIAAFAAVYVAYRRNTTKAG
jgi:hypothetical protein